WVVPWNDYVVNALDQLVRPASAAQLAREMIGTFAGGSSGGPIASHLRWTFNADGTFQMEGDPSIAERGKWEVVSRGKQGSVTQLTVRFHGRQRCGPCSGNPPRMESADETREQVELVDAETLRLRGLLLKRAP